MTNLVQNPSVSSTDLVSIIGGIPKTNSLIVAERFEKNHKDVLRAIDGIMQSTAYQERRERNFALTFYSVPGPNGATREERMIEMDRQGFEVLAMGFTGDEALRWKFRYSDAFNQMEAALRAPQSAPSLIDPDTRFIASRVGHQWVLYEVPHNAYILPAEDWPAVIRGANFPAALVSDILAAATDRVVGKLGPAIVNDLPRPSMVPLQDPPREPRRRAGRPSSATRAITQAQPAAEALGGLGLQDEAERVLSVILNHRVRVQPDHGPAFLWSIGELARYGSGEPLTPPGRISYREVNRAMMAYGCRVSEDRQRLLISNTHPAVEARLRDTPWSTGWYRVLKRIDGARSEVKTYYWPGHVYSKAVSVPLEKADEILADA